jgi:hypothetical protein
LGTICKIFGLATIGKILGSRDSGLTTTSLASIFYCFSSFFIIRFGFGAGLEVRTRSVFLTGTAYSIGAASS